jgi:uncharacterized damage-inducible protein DinB
MTRRARAVRYGAGMNGSLLDDAFGHHVWATLTLLDVCAGLDEEQLATTVPGTFGTLIDTLRHTVGADVGYLTVFSQDGPSFDEDTADIPTMRAAMEAMGPAWASLLATDLDPATPVTRNRDDGSTSTAPLGVRLAQVIHHGTDHRSQVCTALTTLGIEPPEIDVWAYAWKDDRLVETEPTT